MGYMLMEYIFTSLEATLVHYCWLFKLQSGWTIPTILVKVFYLISFTQQKKSLLKLWEICYCNFCLSTVSLVVNKKNHNQGMWDGSPLCSVSSSFGYSSCQLTKTSMAALQYRPRDSQHLPEPKSTTVSHFQLVTLESWILMKLHWFTI